MKGGSLAHLVGRLREAVRPAEADALTDAELLRRWVTYRDESAFELLVWRHGRLVLSVCRRLLHRPQDVEDAFQATFLVLVRKANGIAQRQAVAAWLHTVAFRIASEARSRNDQTRFHDSSNLDHLVSGELAPPGMGEVRQVLDEEVSRLPEKYRVPFILCYLQGKTNEEAARELGRPVGTILSRLSRAREWLRERLTRRGITPSAIVLGPALASEIGSLPVELASVTSKAALSLAAGTATAGLVSAPAVALMEGALRTMFIAKIKTAVAVVLSVAVLSMGGNMGGSGAFGIAHGGEEGQKASSVAQSTNERDDQLEEIRKLNAQLEIANAQVKMLQAQLNKLRERRAPVTATAPRGSGGGGSTAGTAPATGARPTSTAGAGGGTTAAPSSAPPGLTRSGTERVNPSATNTKELNDRVLLSRVRLEAKEAELKAASAKLQQAIAKFKQAEQAKIGGLGDDTPAAKAAVAISEAEVKTKEAELLEARLLADQAMRLLKTSAIIPSFPSALPPRSLEQRVKELEDRLQRIEKAFEGTRRRLPPSSGTVSPR